MKALRFIVTTGAALAFVVPAAHAELDAVTIVRPLTAHTYQLEIQNTSSIGSIKTFDWAPQPELKITAITSTTGGTCRLANNTITCTGIKRGISAPTCTCRPGGTMTVNFSATGNMPTFNGRYWTHYGIASFTVITKMTSTPYHIPSYESPNGYYDLPLCLPGTEPTEAHPCML